MSESPPLKRPRFFPGRLITSADLELEQQYFLEKLNRHNRRLHGFGIVSGLRVTARSGQIVIEPGLALDCEGNELASDTALSIVPPANGDWPLAYLNVHFVERGADPIPASGGDELSTITESVEFVFAPENSNRGHRHLRARWLACGKPHPLTIAKLRRGPQGWRVERGYRAPAIK
ncbi:MAG TPA: hypothetical protein VGO73_03985 [Pyrinomonadaceae bacterium]|jgi:hypothetical protein|nr:hypothetical protein [Pyrinomonadaceae bacterium]